MVRISALNREQRHIEKKCESLAHGRQSEVLLEERETAAAPREHGATTCLTSSFDDAASGVGWAEEATEQILVRDRRFWGQCDMKRKTPAGRGWSS